MKGKNKMSGLYHFMKDGEVWHCFYTQTLKKEMAEFRKVPGTEEKCNCPEREAERQILLELKSHQEMV